MAERFITAKEMAESIIQELKGHPLYACLDYALGEGDLEIKSDDFSVIFRTEFGGSEGIYTDLFLIDDFGVPGVESYHICTLKTLGDSDDYYRAMTSLGTEFVILARKYRNKNQDLLYRVGYKYEMYKADGTLYGTRFCITYEEARDCAMKWLATNKGSAKVINCETLEVEAELQS